MAERSYDIVFSGDILPGADPDAVRDRIRTLFKLPEKTVSRLFSGRPVTIKRGVDPTTAARYRNAFLEAGAIVEALPTLQTEGGWLASDGDVGTAPEKSGGGPVGELGLAPIDDQPLEVAPATRPLTIDVSHLTLVPGYDWTLEDCAPTLPPLRLPDIGHLRLVEPEPVPARHEGTDD